MILLDWLERKFGQFTIPNLTAYLIAGQVLVFLTSFTNSPFSNLFYLEWNKVLIGEWWRIFTFVFLPLSESPIFAAFVWYIYYLFGSALELQWGSFRYTLYLFTVYILTIICAIVFPTFTISNGYMFGSLFLAFAYLYPDFPINIFFILPIKVKWLGLLTWASYISTVLFGSLPAKVLVGTSIINFLLFFGHELAQSLFYQTKILSKKSNKALKSPSSFMSCSICKSTEIDRKIFYWCHTCVPDSCFCEDHIRTHTHLK